MCGKVNEADKLSLKDLRIRDVLCTTIGCVEIRLLADCKLDSMVALKEFIEGVCDVLPVMQVCREHSWPHFRGRVRT